MPKITIEKLIVPSGIGKPNSIEMSKQTTDQQGIGPTSSIEHIHLLSKKKWLIESKYGTGYFNQNNVHSSAEHSIIKTSEEPIIIVIVIIISSGLNNI